MSRVRGVCWMIGPLLVLGSFALSAAAQDVPAAVALMDELGRIPDAVFPWPAAIEPGMTSTAAQPSSPHAHPSYVDLDALDELAEPWRIQILPDGLIYRNYMAGAKESRLSAKLFNERDQGWLVDATLGGRIGLLRYGSDGPYRPQGWQLDVEGSAQLRLDPPSEVDFIAVDFRAGVPLTYASGANQFKVAYYHLSSHVGDEFLLKRPGFRRLNFARDVLVFGVSRYLGHDWRVYGEAGWAFYDDVSEPWELQFGLEYSPCCPTGLGGAPFLAVNAHLRQEVRFGGSLTAQAGWAWRADHHGHLLRLGFHYYNGESTQYSFFDEHEQQFGLGVWYDW